MKNLLYLSLFTAFLSFCAVSEDEDSGGTGNNNTTTGAGTQGSGATSQGNSSGGGERKDDGRGCKSNEHKSGELCVLDNTPTSCSKKGINCNDGIPPNSNSTCDGESCGFECLKNYKKDGGRCIIQKSDVHRCNVDTDCSTFLNYCKSTGCRCTAQSKFAEKPDCPNSVASCHGDPCKGRTPYCDLATKICKLK